MSRSDPPTALRRAAPDRAVEPVLSVRGLSVAYRSGGATVVAVGGVDFEVGAGEIVALVGESGSGKSTIARALLRMLPAAAAVTSGSVLFDGRDLLRTDRRGIEDVRGRLIGWVPQDPMVTLNPLHRIADQVEESLRVHGAGRPSQRRARSLQLLGDAGIDRPEHRAEQYPHELSGGMRQRVLIAGALVAAPRLVIADEPTTALDVTVQKRILDDLERLVAKSGTAVLLITHDLAMAADRADRVIVLRDGAIVESGPSAAVLRASVVPYTRLLIASAPNLSDGRVRSSSIRVAAPVAARPLLVVENLRKSYPASTRSAPATPAVDDVSFSLSAGETLAIVGESGSGKSTLAKLVLGLDRPDDGRIAFDGRDVATLSGPSLRSFRREAQLVYQNPYGSLNPRMSVLDTLTETFRGFATAPRRAWRSRAADLLDRVGLAPGFLDRLPSELSGGQRQRVAIARALAAEPKLIVCDEPVSALDVSVQAQVLDLFSELQETLGLSYLFISHDLAVVRRVADRIVVMRAGRIVEAGSADAVFRSPQAPYTRLLLDAIPGGRFVPPQPDFTAVARSADV